MKLNSDLSRLAIVKQKDATWVPSPQPGVDRLMLERVGAEKVSRATSIVKYDRKSSFPEHTHDGGEEFFVLNGTFSDATGDFDAGFYVRNPVGSNHAPWSDEGTDIFVKLGQFDPDDRTYVRLDTRGADWQKNHELGLKTLLLHQYGPEMVRLVTMEPARSHPEHMFPGGAEIFVVSGSLEISGTQMTKNDWLRSPAGAELSIASKAGATFYFKTGHLPGASK